MNSKLLKEPCLMTRIISDRNKTKRILLSLLVVVMVGGAFFYVFQTRDFLGETLSSAIINRIQEKESSQELGPMENESKISEIKESRVYKEKAVHGDGLTHIARRVLDRHAEKNEIKDLTAEHRIYIEDYIQKKLGSETVFLDQEISISSELISEAINFSRELTDNQLNNLNQYSLLVPSL